MRFSSCYKLVQLTGFFVNSKFLQYGQRWSAHNVGTGSKLFLRKFALVMGDGRWVRGYSKRRPFFVNRILNLGLLLLQFTTPFMSISSPWSWRLLLNLKLRSYKSSRWKKNLPSNGQRTRSNAMSITRCKDLAVKRLQIEGWGNILGLLVKKKIHSTRRVKVQKSPSKVTKKKPFVQKRKMCGARGCSLTVEQWSSKPREWVRLLPSSVKSHGRVAEWSKAPGCKPGG